jgi:vitamin B12 transporter
VAEALATLPGVVVLRNGALGALSGVSIRGAAPSQTLILLDGLPLGGEQTGTLDLGEISTSGVERIEVVEGGGSTLYGAGAIGGIVNILTSHAPRAVQAKVIDGSFGTREVAIETQHVSFERLVASNDFPTVAGAVPGGPRINSDVESTTARVRGERRLGRLELQGSAGISDVHLGAPGPLYLPYVPSSSSGPTPNPSSPNSYASSTSRQDTTSSDARASLTLRKAHATTTLDLSGTRQVLQYASAPSDLNGCFCNVLNRETRLEASLRNAVQTDRTRLVYGLDLARGLARIDSGNGAPPVHAFAQAAVYGQDDVTLGTGTAYAGLRAERDGAQGGALAPSAGFALPLDDGLRLRANAATGFRAPNAVDLYYPGFSNPNLQPERTVSTDLTLEDARVLGGLSLGYFTLAGNDLIAINPNFDFTKPSGPNNLAIVNVQRASIAGLTLSVRTVARRGITVGLGLTDLYRALDLTSVARRLPQRPVFSTNLTLEYAATNPRATLAALGAIANAMGARGTVPQNGPLDPYLVAAPFASVDAYVRLRVARHALLTLRERNLGNERYAAVAGYPTPGRAFVLELSTR